MTSIRTFNRDKSEFQKMCQSTGKVLPEKWSRNVNSMDEGSSKDNMTIMLTFSANGKCTPPLTVYPQERIPENTCPVHNQSIQYVSRETGTKPAWFSFFLSWGTHVTLAFSVKFLQ